MSHWTEVLSSVISPWIVLRAYRPCDWIEIDGDYGEVQTVGLRAIRLRTAADDIITVAHSRMWDSNVYNSNDGARTLICVVDFYLRPDHDSAAASEAFLDVTLTSAYLEYEKPTLVVLSQ